MAPGVLLFTISADFKFQGMAPTIMVARVALETYRALNHQTAAHISGLVFQEPNADVTVSQILLPVPGGGGP